MNLLFHQAGPCQHATNTLQGKDGLKKGSTFTVLKTPNIGTDTQTYPLMT